jgi:hypothetical protein
MVGTALAALPAPADDLPQVILPERAPVNLTAQDTRAEAPPDRPQLRWSRAAGISGPQADAPPAPPQVLAVSTAAAAPRPELLPPPPPGPAPVALPQPVVPPPPPPPPAPANASPKTDVVVESRPPGWWDRCKADLQGLFAVYPEGVQPVPLGVSVHACGQTMVDNGVAAQTALYQYDFVEGQAQLNARGREELLKILAVLPRTFAPIVIERTPGRPEIDLSRRVTVHQELATSSFPVPLERIIVGPLPAHGMDGLEAEIIHRNLLMQTATAGGAAPPGGGPAPGGPGPGR